jgi:hypothetical protein
MQLLFDSRSKETCTRPGWLVGFIAVLLGLGLVVGGCSTSSDTQQTAREDVVEQDETYPLKVTGTVTFPQGEYEGEWTITDGQQSITGAPKLGKKNVTSLFVLKQGERSITSHTAMEVNAKLSGLKPILKVLSGQGTINDGPPVALKVGSTLNLGGLSDTNTHGSTKGTLASTNPELTTVINVKYSPK